MAGMFLEPIPAVLKAFYYKPEADDEPVLLLGYVGDDRMLFCHVDGELDMAPYGWFEVDYRYNHDDGTWSDPKAPPSPAEEDVEDNSGSFDD